MTITTISSALCFQQKAKECCCESVQVKIEGQFKYRGQDDSPISLCIMHYWLSYTKEEKSSTHPTGEQHTEPTSIIVLGYIVFLNIVLVFKT